MPGGRDDDPRVDRKGGEPVMKTALRIVSMAALLFGFWLILSGHYTAWLVVSGAMVSIAIALIGLRFGFTDREGHPIEWLLRGLAYWPWLVKEIAVSSWQVTKIILNPSLPISPRLIHVTTTQKSSVGVATYANSITLTPGTITIEVDRASHDFYVHALTKEGAEGLYGGDMDRRVTAFETIG